MILSVINDILYENRYKPDIIKIWYIKEVLQAYVLDFIYSHPDYKKLIFYGWTSLRFLFDINRLSEDLDFIWPKFDDYENLWKDLTIYISDKLGIEVVYKIQKFRVLLSFRNFLEQFNLSFGNSSDLYIKIEILDHFHFCDFYELTYYPRFKYNKSLMILSLDVSSLFSTKINAVLYRKWERKFGTDKISVKWRDIYDMFWYLNQGYIPNPKCIDGVVSLADLKEKLIAVVEKVNFVDVVKDIENFVDNNTVLDFMKKDGKNYILGEIKKFKNKVNLI